ncbi:MAG TPA: carboxypeptidase regulatory-like domain-containing protein [Terriglobales bacterium]|nr:carboxypeptidase regulatory-like domain-containing protein [Terriglobales bacterium]
MRPRAIFIALLCLLALVAVSVVAQTGTSRITGTVVDKTGAMVSGAAVTATNQGTNVSYTTRTSTAGAYSFESVQPGVYQIKVESEGFRTFITAGNQLSIGQPMTVNVTLEVGAAAQTVQVEAAAEMVQTSTSGNFGNVVDQNAVTELPIITTRGRNPLDLVNFQPGVTVGSNAGGGIHVHGSRDRAWDYTLDGIDVNETSSGGGGTTPLKVNPDMLSEFRVVTGNASADIGRASGGQVQMVTKSGTNEFHGSGFFFYQTPGLNANEVGNKISDPPLGRPQFIQKLGGFSLGGPIFKNKTFFFFNYQFLRTLANSKYTSIVYTQAARNGTFRYVKQPMDGSGNLLCGGDGQPDCPSNSPALVDSSGNVLPGVDIGSYVLAANDPRGLGLDPRMQQFIAMTPLPNDFTRGDGLNTAGFSWNSPENHKQDDYVFKIDHNFSDRNSVFVRYAWGHQNTLGDTANAGQAPFPNAPRVVDTYRKPRNLAINWRFTPNARMTNEFVVGMNRFGYDFANPDPAYTTVMPFCFQPICGWTDLTGPVNNEAGNIRTLTTIQANDNLSITRGNHTMRMGFSIRYQRHIDNRGSIGSYNALPHMWFDTDTNPVDVDLFNLPDDMNIDMDQAPLQSTINNLLGRVGQINVGFVSDGKNWFPAGSWFNFDSRFPEYDLYFQDSWKVKSNLTIDGGLRWEMKLSPRNPRNMILRPKTPLTLEGTPTDSATWVPGKLWDDQIGNIGPSIGFAWDPFKNGKTSIRGNYRLAFDRINTFVISSSIIQSLPGYTYSLNNTAFGEHGGNAQDPGGRLADCTINGPSIVCGGQPLAPPPGETPESMRTPPPFSTNWTTVIDPKLKTPRTHMWGFSIQRELPRSMVLELNYLGRHGTSLFGGYDSNAHEIFKNGFLDAFNTVKNGGDSPLINALLAGKTANGSAWLRSQYSTRLKRNDVAYIAKVINQLTTSTGQQLIVANGFSPYFFVKYPQFADEVDVLDTHDFANYHAFEVQLQRRMTGGLQFQVSYTLSKSLDTRSYDPTFTTIPTGSYQSSSSIPWDNSNRRRNYASSDFDRRHMLQGNFIYELPFGRGKLLGRNASGVLDKIIGGFQVAGIVTLQSGRPFTAYSGAYTFNRTVMTPASCDDCSPDMGNLHWTGDPYTSDLLYFTPEQKSKFYQPPAGQLSNVGRNYFRLPNNYNLDMAIAKKFKITEHHQLELRLDMQNVTNSVMYDLPYSSTITSSYFGDMKGQTFNASRKMQLVAKYTF